MGCAKNEDCAKQCVKNYMKRHGASCTRKAYYQITCDEFAGIHNGGAGGCNSPGTAPFRGEVKKCMDVRHYECYRFCRYLDEALDKN